MLEKENDGSLKPVYTVPSVQLEALLAKHIEEVRSGITDLNRQQVRVVSKESV